MASQSSWKILKDKVSLSDEERQMYAAERLDNFRWIAQLLASSSPVPLTDAALVAPDIKQDIRDIGQFAELIYSSVPIERLLEHIDTLTSPGYPLEYHDALKDATLEEFFYGSVAKLPAALFHRSSRNQVVISITGTTQIQHIAQDLRFLKTKHPSGNGSLHSGFWSLYGGLAEQAKAALQKALETHNPSEVVVTGHSMGGAVAYLLCMDLLSEEAFSELPTIKLITFGSPRVGDEAFVTYFRSLAKTYREKHGEDSFLEYAIRGFNDGVPTLPPLKLGFRHFAERPIYSTGDQLYNIPASESEYGSFQIEGGPANPSVFPRGGHNYYNGRELEKLLRRISWLEKAKYPEEGWQDRYRAIADKKP